MYFGYKVRINYLIDPANHLILLSGVYKAHLKLLILSLDDHLA